jgi:peptidoglycan/xylan/chitin deacetylase (PgdA/CDA1 family)
VLGYHAVSDDWTSDLSVGAAALEQQLTTLVRRGYRGATFAEAMADPGEGRTVVVTFDDAYRSVAAHALPILAKLGLPGTVFVPTSFTDGGRLASWSGIDVHLKTRHAHELEVMDWAELRSLTSLGWEVGSHTCSHPMLTQLADDDLLRELVESREACERHLGARCHSIAYPYGDTDARVVAATARAGYTAAAGLPPARKLHRTSPLNWPRIGIFFGDGPLRFKAKVSPAGRRLRTLLP